MKGAAAGQEQKEWEEELAKRFRQAWELTTSASEDVRGKVYSVQEWNLLLEYLHYGRPANREERYREVLCAAGESRFDSVSQARIYGTKIQGGFLSGSVHCRMGM